MHFIIDIELYSSWFWDPKRVMKLVAIRQRFFVRIFEKFKTGCDNLHAKFVKILLLSRSVELAPTKYMLLTFCGTSKKFLLRRPAFVTPGPGYPGWN